MKFSIEKDNYKEEVEIELSKVSLQSGLHATCNTIKHSGILTTKIKRIGQKRNTMPYELIDTIHIKGLQQLDHYDKLNPAEITTK